MRRSTEHAEIEWTRESIAAREHAERQLATPRSPITAPTGGLFRFLAEAPSLSTAIALTVTFLAVIGLVFLVRYGFPF